MGSNRVSPLVVSVTSDDPSLGPLYTLPYNVSTDRLLCFYRNIVTIQTWILRNSETLSRARPFSTDTCLAVFSDPLLLEIQKLARKPFHRRGAKRNLLLRTIYRFHQLLVQHHVHIDTTFWLLGAPVQIPPLLDFPAEELVDLMLEELSDDPAISSTSHFGSPLFTNMERTHQIQQFNEHVMQHPILRSLLLM
jgi:hypothetical protein